MGCVHVPLGEHVFGRLCNPACTLVGLPGPVCTPVSTSGRGSGGQADICVQMVCVPGHNRVCCLCGFCQVGVEGWEVQSPVRVCPCACG